MKSECYFEAKFGVEMLPAIHGLIAKLCAQTGLVAPTAWPETYKGTVAWMRGIKTRTRRSKPFVMQLVLPRREDSAKLMLRDRDFLLQVDIGIHRSEGMWVRFSFSWDASQQYHEVVQYLLDFMALCGRHETDRAAAKAA